MMRNKETLAYISNNDERKASYLERKKELIDEVSELRTLYGVDACVVIYSEYEPEPVVWPSHIEAQAILARFQKVSEMEQNCEIHQRIEKAEDQLRRFRYENRCHDLVRYVHECIEGKHTFDDTHFSDVAEKNMAINQTLREIDATHNAIMAESQRRQSLHSHASVNSAVAKL